MHGDSVTIRESRKQPLLSSKSQQLELAACWGSGLGALGSGRGLQTAGMQCPQRKGLRFLPPGSEGPAASSRLGSPSRSGTVAADTNTYGAGVRETGHLKELTLSQGCDFRKCPEGKPPGGGDRKGGDRAWQAARSRGDRRWRGRGVGRVPEPWGVPEEWHEVPMRGRWADEPEGPRGVAPRQPCQGASTSDGFSAPETELPRGCRSKKP